MTGGFSIISEIKGVISIKSEITGELKIKHWACEMLGDNMKLLHSHRDVVKLCNVA